MSLNIKTQDGYQSVIAGIPKELKYTAKENSGIAINNIEGSEDYRTISNTGVISVEQAETNGAIKVKTSSNEPEEIAIKGLNNAAYKNIDTEISTTGEVTSVNLPTTKAVVDYVVAKVGALPKPMQIKGTLGTETGAIGSLDAAAEANTGFVYLVVTNGTYASKSAKVGDMFVSNGKEWLFVPSANDGANEILMANYTTDKTSAGKTAIANSDTVTKAIGKVDNRLADAETEIGKKVNKTSVSSSTETTSVINVTDAKAQMAMVAKISGKTVKDGDTLKSAVVESVVSQGRNKNDEVYEPGYFYDTGAENNNNGGYRTKSYIPVKPSTTYYMNGTDVVITKYNASKSPIGYILWRKGSQSFTTDSNTHYIRLATPSNAALPQIAIFEGSTVIPYIPYNKTTVLVPQSIRNLPDYGIEGNYIDFENGIYHHKRTKDNPFKNNTWAYNTTLSAFFTEATVKNLVSADYSLVTTSPMSDKTMAVNNLDNVSYWTTRVVIKDNAYGTNVENFTEAIRKKEFEYELTNEEVISLTDFIRPLPVENGGTLTLVNEHNLDMPSVIKYKKEVN